MWAKAANKRGLENLYIQLPRNYGFRLSPSSIFCSKTLVVLKLVALKVDESSFDLPSLKILHLKDVQFPEQQYLVDLLSGCPILEYMNLRVIHYVHDDRKIPSNKNLGSLSKLVRANI